MNQKDIGRHLSEINNLIHREIVKSSPSKDENFDYENHVISHAGSSIISYLDNHADKDIFQRDLEHEFSVRRSTVSKILTALEQKEYIKRVAVSSDRRLKKIVLTDKAKLLTDRIKLQKKILEEKMTSGLSEEELSAFKATLEKIKQNLSEEDES